MILGYSYADPSHFPRNTWETIQDQGQKTGSKTVTIKPLLALENAAVPQLGSKLRLDLHPQAPHFKGNNKPNEQSRGTMSKIYFEDVSIGDEATFGAYKVTKGEIIEFAGKYDPQPFHLDEAAAQNSVFGALCASGWHTCAMMMRMLVDNMKETGFASLGSPGMDGIEWKRPVFVGDTLSVKTNVTAKRESKSRPSVGLMKGTNIVLNQNGETVMVMHSNYMVARRPA